MFRAAIFWIAYAVFVAALMVSCEIDSGEHATRGVDIDVEGLYSGGPLVSGNTDGSITSLDIHQAGDRLEAVDNRGILYKGTIGQVTAAGESATYTIRGNNLNEVEITASGVFQMDGDKMVMTGTWIEPDKYCTIYGSKSWDNGLAEMTEAEKEQYSSKGCCSHHDGLSGYYHTGDLKLQCNDGTFSPSCTYGQ
ncbi:MAG: hypothetical protein EOM12_14960 [Verrucomicrobiae bacterium]|nr:hypothetical protein [Verrucomicrobiae bacterium]